MMTFQKAVYLKNIFTNSNLYLDDILKIVTEREDETALENYVSSLLKYAQEEGLKDVYSNCALYNESLYSIVDNNELKRLIENIRNILDNETFKDIIDLHISRDGLKALYIKLIHIEIENISRNKRKSITNELTSEIQNQL